MTNPQKFLFWAAIHGNHPETGAIIQSSFNHTVETTKEMMPDRFKKWLDEIISQEGKRCGTVFGVSNCGVVY